MKPCYMIRLGGYRCAIADVCPTADHDVFMLTRINVPAGFRSQGYGRALLEQVLEDADAAGVKLQLEINPYGELDYNQLRKWYERNGFEEIEDNLFERNPI